MKNDRGDGSPTDTLEKRKNIDGTAPTYRAMFLTVLIGCVGGGTLGLTGIPAGPIIGSSIAVGICALIGLKVRCNSLLQCVGFSLVGIGIGVSISTETFDLSSWLVSIILSNASTFSIFCVGIFLLNRLFSFDKTTAALCSFPGALGQTVEVSISEGADVAAVITCQCFRLTVTVLFISIFASTTGIVLSQTASAESISWQLSGLILIVSLVAGYLASRMAVPAAYILAGLIVGCVFRDAGVVSGTLPDVLMFIGFVLVGCAVGVGFANLGLQELKANSLAALALFVTASLISAVYAAVAAFLTSVSFFQAWVAFSPGAAETMAAIALSTNIDPSYVAAHHVIRILCLSVLIVVLFRRPRKV
ncbi:AbrB family transcriptional regulator [Roseovarius pacificus]|uniref:AbrB family transcriptional regulator n=1 Tax=Roseovarius pacificus TaxID=337701 RepID=UPI002A1897D9|nr:AbrB family transcriptional regulator [Roseovarius pacificus]